MNFGSRGWNAMQGLLMLPRELKVTAGTRTAFPPWPACLSLHIRSHYAPLIGGHVWQVVWAEQQFTKPRQKRDFNRVPPDDGPPLHAGAASRAASRGRRQLRYAAAGLAASAIYRGAQELNDTRLLAGKLGCSLQQPGGVTPAQRARLFNDELWSKQWYLVSSEAAVLETQCGIR